MFRNELEMLKFRLEHLKDVVYRHVIVEADITFGGLPKPFYFAENRAEFKPWLNRIIHISVTAADLPKGIDPPCTSPEPRFLSPKGWKREHAQREYCKRGLGGAKPEDVILHGDVDEIPSLGALGKVGDRKKKGPVVLRQRNHIFAVDWLHPDPWYGTIAIPYRKIRGDGKPFSFQELRSRRHKLPRVKGGGWHFSWLGGPDAIAAKVPGRAHQETSFMIEDANASGRLYEQGWCPWDDCQLTPVEVDGTWPGLIQDRKCPDLWFRPREGVDDNSLRCRDSRTSAS